MYCKSCGRTLPDGVTYCDVCEIELSGSGKRGFVDEGLVTLPNETTNWLSRRVQANGVVWLFIALYQIIAGIPLAVAGYGIAMIACGIWNIVQCAKDFRFSKQILACNNIEHARSIVTAIDRSKNSTIVFLFINLFLGGILGVIGCIFWLALRSKVLDRAPEMGVYD